MILSYILGRCVEDDMGPVILGATMFLSVKNLSPTLFFQVSRIFLSILAVLWRQGICNRSNEAVNPKTFSCLTRPFGNLSRVSMLNSTIITYTSSEARHKFRFASCFFYLCRGLQPLDVILDILDSD